MLRGVSEAVTVSGFPTTGSNIVLRWQESQQNFVITTGSPGSGGTSGSPPRVLENPQPGSFQSGVGVISGWVCDASQIEIEFNNDAANRWPAGYGTQRTDTRGVCGDTDNGFGLLFNWNKLGEGTHTVRAFADGTEFARATVTVTTLGQEFVRGVSKETILPNFPQTGSDTVLRWQQAQQNFVIAESSTLRLAAPDPLSGFFAGVTDSLQPVVRYTGKYSLSFALPTAPTGMAIDARTGTLTWTPREADTGRTFNVTVRVGDGVLSDSVAFQVSVLTPTTVQTTVSNGVLRVTDTNTTLQGLSIVTTDTGTRTQSTQQSLHTHTDAASTTSLTDLEIEVVETVPTPLPAHVTQLSDFFVIREAFTRPVELTFPVGDLPEGTDIRDVDLFSFREAIHSDGPFWGPTLVDWRYETVNGVPAYVVSLEGLQGLFVFGLQEFVPGTPSTNAVSQAVTTNIVSRVKTSNVTCTREPWYLDLINIITSDDRDQTCTYSLDREVKIRVKNFGEGTQWGGVTIETLAGWMIEAQMNLEDQGLEYDKKILVNITSLDADGQVKLEEEGKDDTFE